MDLHSTIRRILKEETQEPKILRLSLEFFDNNPFKAWKIIQKIIEKKGNPPYSIDGSLDLAGRPIESLGSLQSVGGTLDLYGTPIKSLGNLVSVDGDLYLYDTPIKSLGSLQSVGGDLDLDGTPLSKMYTKKQIRQMVNVKGDIVL